MMVGEHSQLADNSHYVMPNLLKKKKGKLSPHSTSVYSSGDNDFIVLEKKKKYCEKRTKKKEGKKKKKNKKI